MNYEKLTLDELQQGYWYSQEQESYICNYCEKNFQKGIIFPMGEFLLEAERAVSTHIEKEHGGNFSSLIHSDSKYNSLTKNQMEILSHFQSGMSDKDIAKKFGIAEATIRRQRFTFREKAKQAKLYLAIYNQVFEGKPLPVENAIIPIHNTARQVDDRFVITEQEKQYVLETCFLSQKPLVLKNFSRKEKKKVVILMRIADEFEPGRQYSEKEINGIIEPIYSDFVTIRRYLIEYGFLSRTNDGSKYWLIAR